MCALSVGPGARRDFGGGAHSDGIDGLVRETGRLVPADQAIHHLHAKSIVGASMRMPATVTPMPPRLEIGQTDPSCSVGLL
jgi:hypothetical protein